MVTVKQFKEAGFKFVSHDVINYKSGKLWDELNVLSKEQMQDLYMYADDLVVESLAWRKNTGVQPVGDDCWVEVLYVDGGKDLALASEFFWGNEDNLTHWKPSLKHMEKQMNDNQETKTALEMSERDMCGVVENEWINGDECVYVNDKETIYTYVGMHPHGDGHYIFNDEKGITYVANGYIHEPETPEEKASRERMESAYDLFCTFKDESGVSLYCDYEKWVNTQPVDSWLAIVDKTGYRK